MTYKKRPSIDRRFFVFQQMVFDSLEGFVADSVFQPAGILGGSFPGDAQRDQQSGKERVPLIDFFCHGDTGFGKGDSAVGSDFNETALFLADP